MLENMGLWVVVKEGEYDHMFAGQVFKVLAFVLWITFDLL